MWLERPDVGLLTGGETHSGIKYSELGVTRVAIGCREPVPQHGLNVMEGVLHTQDWGKAGGKERGKEGGRRGGRRGGGEGGGEEGDGEGEGQGVGEGVVLLRQGKD